MLYLAAHLLSVGTRWEMTGIGAAIAAALFAFLGALSPLRRIVFPPHIVFAGWVLGERNLPEYREWHHAKFCNGRSHWRTSEALRCEAFAEIERDDGKRSDDPEPLIVARRPTAKTEWGMRRNECDEIPVVLENSQNRVLGFDEDVGRIMNMTPAGVYLTDSHFIFGTSGRSALAPSVRRIRVRLEYDGRKAFSSWQDVPTPEMAS